MATAVQSSVLTTVDYDYVARVLSLTFHSGKTYHYLDVPAYRYDELLKAPSKGKYYSQHIRSKYQTSEGL